MLQAMYNGVSGLQAEQQWMDVIGNNIANVNTTGYKSNTVSFEDQLSQTLQGASAASGNVGGTDPIQKGLGVQVAAIGTNDSQGGLESTGVDTDMAISGNGYFMLGDGASTSYTRDGSFSLDNQGDLVSANGSYVLGWAANSQGTIDSTQPITSASKLQIPVGSLTITNPTSSASFSGNLSADAPASSNPTGTYTRSVNVYDSLGEKQPVTLTFNNLADAPPQPAPTADTASGSVAAGTYQVQVSYVYPSGTGTTESNASDPPVSVTLSSAGSIQLSNMSLPTGATGFNVYVNGNLANATPETGTSATLSSLQTSVTQAPPEGVTNEWSWSAGTTQNPGVGSGTITFGPSGTTSSTGSISVPTVDGAGTPVNVALDFSQMTQVAGSSTAAPLTVNGSAPGVLQSFNIDDTGTVTGVFSNGQSQALGQVALASFQNPEGLSSNGANEYSTTPDSGNPTVGTASSNGLGGIDAGYVEQSNVDLSNEFTNMIISQRGFEANTKIVSTVNTLLSDVIGLIQG